MSAAHNRAQKDKKRRAQLRARLERDGAHPELIERIIEEQRRQDLIARHGEERARELFRQNAARGPDDTGYQPTKGDPLLRGAARATGMTAQVVRRRNTITRFQHQREVEHGQG